MTNRTFRVPHDDGTGYFDIHIDPDECVEIHDYLIENNEVHEHDFMHFCGIDTLRKLAEFVEAKNSEIKELEYEDDHPEYKQEVQK